MDATKVILFFISNTNQIKRVLKNFSSMIRILYSLISVPNFERAGHECNFKIQYNRNCSYTYSLFKFEEITTSHKSIVVYKQTSIIENSFILYCSGVRILKLLVT